VTSGDRDAKIAPPLRTAEDNEGLWRGIQNGTIDTVASDHAPKLKETEDDLIRGVPPMEIFSFITQTLLRPGDRAFVESPSYDRSITLLRRASAKVVGIPLSAHPVDHVR
jgi:dihydroorotase-like cyclic amidohydrolase